MSRFVRRAALLTALVAAVAVPLSAAGAGAQEEPAITITVRKVVVGTGAPSAVTVNCDSPDVVLNFDAAGNPTTSTPADQFFAVDGAWVASGGGAVSGSCTFTETTTGGASSTAWTCDYTSTPPLTPTAQQVEGGCDADSGSGVGPVTANFVSSEDAATQTGTVVFTNTFTTTPLTPLQPAQPAAAVVTQPAFTG